ncbi:hypothetical protein KKF03_00400, partial [Patescibacteria group bacterium]|nr:hypothetical protein [Patescibacteria group bacterium]
MLNPMDHHRLSRWASCERRVCRKVGGVEAIRGLIHQAEEKLGNEVESTRILESVDTQLKSEKLSEAERVEISHNIEKLEGKLKRRTNVRESTADKRFDLLAHIRSWLDKPEEPEAQETVESEPQGQFSVPPQGTKPPEAKPSPGAEAAAKKKEDAKKKEEKEKDKSVVGVSMMCAEKVTETVFPKKWTKDMTPQNKRIVGTAITAGGVLVAGWLLFAFMKGRSAAKEKKGGFFRKLIFGGLVAGAALVGGTYVYEKFKKDIDKAVAAVKDAGEQAVAGVKKAGESVANKFNEVTGRGEKVEGEETVADETVEEGSEVLKDEALAVFGSGLLLLHSDIAEEVGLDKTQENQKEAIVSALISISPQLTLDKFLQVQNKQDAQNLLDARPDNAIALLFIAKIVQKYEPTMKAMWEREEQGEWKPSTVTIMAFLKRLGDLPKTIARMGDALKGKRIQDVDVRELMKSVFSDENGESSINYYEHPTFFARACALEPEIKGKEKTLSKYCVKYRRWTVSDYRQKISQDTVEAKTLTKIVDLVTSDQMKEYLLLYTHNRPETAKHLKSQIDKLTISDVLQIFFYSNLANGELPERIDNELLASGDDVGSMLMQLKVLDLVGKENLDEGTKFQYALILSSNNLGLPDGVKEKFAAFSLWAGKQAVGVAASPAKNLWRHISSFWTEYRKASPEVAYPVEGTVVFGATGVTGRSGYKFWKWLTRSKEIWMEDRMQSLASLENKPGWLGWRKLFRFDFKEEAIRGAGTIKDLLHESRMILDGMGAEAKELRNAYHALHRRGYFKASFEQFRNEVTTLRSSPPVGAKDASRFKQHCDELLSKMDDIELKAPVMHYRQNLPKRLWLTLTGRAPSNIGVEATQYSRNINKLLEDKELIRMVSRSGSSTGDALSLMELARDAGRIELDSETLILIRSSRKAKEIIAGAIATIDEAEILRALNAAKSARNLRLAGNVLGAGADVFGLYMAYADWQENGKKIKETNNPALKELYSSANQLYAVEGGSSALGLSIGGIAVVSTYNAGASVLTALAAPAGSVMLPIGLAVAGTRYYYKELEAAQEGWLKDASDWQKEDNAAVLAEIERLAPGSSTVGQRVSTTEHLGYQTKANL